MKAVILAAGEGTRMRPFTRAQPKVMLSIGNRPFLEYLIRALARNGVRDVIIVVGYHKERIMSYFKDGSDFGVTIQYVHQEKQLGTAHALKATEDYLRNETTFLLLAGDNIIEQDDLIEVVGSPDDEALVITTSHSSTKYGVVQIRDGNVVSIEERSIEGFEGQIFTGIGRFTPSIFDHLHEDVFTLTSLIKSRLMKGSLPAIVARSWMDAVYPQDLLRLNSRVLEDLPAGYGGIVEPGVMFKGNVKVSEGTILRAHTYLKGPIVIGEGVDIGPSTAVRGPVSIGENTRIGPFCEIHNAIIMDNVIIEMGCKLQNVIIGSGSRIGARFSSGTNRVQEGLKHGVAIGEDVIIEDNVMISNGRIIGNNVRIEAGKLVDRTLDDRTVVI